MTYTVGTLFSGIGVPDLCARLLGMATVWQVEKEAFPQAVLRKNFPEAELHGDIFDCHDLPYVDLIVAGFPCQPFSVAGQRQGERDPRYLVPEMLRVIDEVRPRVCLLENVPGFASLDDGQSFKRLLGALAEMGLDAEWGHIRASDVGAPHTRERWWLVAHTSSARTWLEEYRSGGQGRQPADVYQPAPIRQEHGALGAARLDAAGNAELAVPGGLGRGQGRSHQPRRHVLHDLDGGAAQSEPARDGWQRGAGAADAARELGNADNRRCGQCDAEQRCLQVADAGCCDDLGDPERSGCSGDARRWSVAQPADGYARDGRQAQPGLGRVLDGLAGGVDGFVPYPARPGAPQYAFEPPRVTSRNNHRAQRLKALGNSMAVDVVFEMMLAIQTWLEAVDAQDGTL